MPPDQQPGTRVAGSPGPGASAMLRGRITIAGIALIVLIIAADAYEGWQDYRKAIDANERIQIALDRAIAEQTTRLVQEADVVLSEFAAWRESPAGRKADEQVLRERLRIDVARLPFIHSAAIAGADGQLLATTQSDPIANRSMRQRPVFTVPEHARVTDQRYAIAAQ